MKRQLIQLLTRKKSPVVFGDLKRNRPISPVFGLDRGMPIDRYYIEGFLQQHRGLIQGEVLEIGESTYTRRFGSAVSAATVLYPTPDLPGATLVGDLTEPAGLPDNRFDCFICTQTFNFIFDLARAIEGAHRLLKPGGVLLATMGGISQISRYDMDRWGDYWRFTTASARRLFESRFEIVDLNACGNVLAATAFLQGVAIEDLPDLALLNEHDPDYQMLITLVARKPA